MVATVKLYGALTCGLATVSCPPPLKNRDLVLLRSWLDTGAEYYVLTHSVSHDLYPPRKGFVRALNYLAGRPPGGLITSPGTCSWAAAGVSITSIDTLPKSLSVIACFKLAVTGDCIRSHALQ